VNSAVVAALRVAGLPGGAILLEANQPAQGRAHACRSVFPGVKLLNSSRLQTHFSCAIISMWTKALNKMGRVV
jgi:hypothetical protein